MSARYRVVEGSQSCHCCFDATVVDTTRPIMVGGRHFNNEYKEVCECLDIEDAQTIVDALNAADNL